MSVDIEPIEELVAFVETACHGDAALLASVTSLLRENERNEESGRYADRCEK